jgi:RNA polymerase sigma-70 factor (ECF subfamily)
VAKPGFAAILDGARSNDRTAWEHLYREHAPAVLGYLRAQHVDSPEDLLGDTFASAVRDIRGFEGDEPDFRNWLLRIACNRLIDHVRSERVRPQRCSAEVPDQPVNDPGLAALEDRQAREQRLEQLLAPLTDTQRAVVYLRYVLDLDQHSTAKVLQISVPAVKMAQARALRRMATEATPAIQPQRRGHSPVGA